MKYVRERSYDIEAGCLGTIIKIILVVVVLWLADFACQKIGLVPTATELGR